MKIKLTVRRRTKIDGISGIQETVKIFCDLQIGESRSDIEFGIDPKRYDEFRPGTMWETELVEYKETPK